MKNIRAASRYAKALLDLTVEKKTEDEVYADMQLVNSVIDKSKDLELLLKSPVVKSDKKENILKEIFGEKIHKISFTFIKLIVSKGREFMLHDICESYLSQYKRHKNILEATIISANKLNEESKKKITQLLNPNGAKVDITEKIDPTLIGGFLVQVDDKQIDATIKGKLLQLKQEFSSNLYESKL